MSGMDFSLSDLVQSAAGVGDAFQKGLATAQQQQDRQLKLAALQRAQADETAARSGIAEALRNGDTNRAAAIAYAYGQDKTGEGFVNLSKLGYERADKSTTDFSNIVAGVAQLPYEQRRAAIQAAKPRLQALGINPAEIDAFDPTDNNIAALSRTGYSYGDQVKDTNTAYSNETGRQNAETARMNAENPVVVGGSLVTKSGTELYRAPQYITSGTDQNVTEVGGTQSQGFAQSHDPKAVFENMVGVESNKSQFGKDGRPLTSPKGAVGIAQVMPSTAPEAARLAGLPWDPVKYRTDPAYNRALGQAYYNEQLRVFGGDAVKAAAAYNAGARRVQHAVAAGGDNWQQHLPSETQGYIAKVFGQQSVTRPTRTIVQGVPKATGAQSQQTQSQREQAARDSYDRAIRTAQSLLNHPGLPSAVGSGFDPHSWGHWNPLSGQPFAGTQTQDFVSQLGALKSQVFLPMVQALRGMGALSDAEGKKLTDSIGALDTNMSEQAFKTNLKQIIGDLSAYRNRGLPAQGATAAAPQGSTATATGPNGQRIALVNGQWVPY